MIIKVSFFPTLSVHDISIINLLVFHISISFQMILPVKSLLIKKLRHFQMCSYQRKFVHHVVSSLKTKLMNEENHWRKKFQSFFILINLSIWTDQFPRCVGKNTDSTIAIRFPINDWSIILVIFSSFVVPHRQIDYTKNISHWMWLLMRQYHHSIDTLFLYVCYN